MKMLSAEEFEKIVGENPRWATTLTESIGVVGCQLKQSPITHLSPLIHFFPNPKGENKNKAASFWACPHLKTACGTFHGWVTFAFSGIEKIDAENLVIHTEKNLAAIFYKCRELKVATGNFPGHVKFKHSGIERIENLNLQTQWAEERRVDLSNTPVKEIPKEILFGTGLIIDPETRDRAKRQLVLKTLKPTQIEL